MGSVAFTLLACNSIQPCIPQSQFRLLDASSQFNFAFSVSASLGPFQFMITNPEHAKWESCEPKKPTNPPVKLAVAAHLQYELVILLFLVHLFLRQGFLWRTCALPWVGSPLAWDALEMRLSSARHQLRSRKSRATSYNLSRKHFYTQRCTPCDGATRCLVSSSFKLWASNCESLVNWVNRVNWVNWVNCSNRSIFHAVLRECHARAQATPAPRHKVRIALPGPAELVRKLCSFRIPSFFFPRACWSNIEAVWECDAREWHRLTNLTNDLAMFGSPFEMEMLDQCLSSKQPALLKPAKNQTAGIPTNLPSQFLYAHLYVRVYVFARLCLFVRLSWNCARCTECDVLCACCCAA